MASRATDQFNRPNRTGLGVADTGQPWAKVRGSDASIINGRAVFPSSSPGAFYVLNTGVGGGDSTCSISFNANDGGGQALYFRVTDVNRWWRLYKRAYTYSYQYQSGQTEPVYGYVGTGSYWYHPSGGWQQTGSFPLNSSHPEYKSYRTVYFDYDTRIGTYRGREDYNNGTMITYQYRSVHEYQNYEIITPSQPIYSTAYATAYEVCLDKCVNGSVSRVKTGSTQNGITSLSVALKGESISAFSSAGNLWTVLDPTHSTAYRHGAGHAETSGSGNTHGIDSFSAVPFVLTGYVPPLML